MKIERFRIEKTKKKLKNKIALGTKKLKKQIKESKSYM